ncbi:Trehalose/maltose import ATP-binding protein MalK [uncultured archaeon]|nr:Trehalose/maltose import ATP-binding protein MalK [uncultured archaeon]
MPMIETQNLAKSYNSTKALESLNLKIEEGEIFGLLGPNGAGNTTTMLMLATLRQPTSGTAKINNYDIIKEPGKVRKSIGIVFQDPSSDDILTGYENLKLHGLLYDMPGELMDSRIKEVLKLVDLTERKDDLVKKYSGGMRRRLELARGLMHHPKILFLDEPTLGLDPQSREHIWEYIERLAKEEKITTIITTHYMEEADKLCNRVAIIDTGKIVAIGSPKKLKGQLGGDMVRLSAKAIDSESLKKLSYVKEVIKCEGGFCLTVDNASGHLQEILKTAGKIDSVEISTPTLGDVFMHYTGRGIREDSPEGGWAERAIHASTKK